MSALDWVLSGDVGARTAAPVTTAPAAMAGVRRPTEIRNQ